MKSYAKVVFVDSKESTTLPAKVTTAIRAAGNSIPLLVFMSPDNETVLGSFNHGTLKNQEYSKIFRDLKKKIKKAKKEGNFKNTGSKDTIQRNQTKLYAHAKSLRQQTLTKSPKRNPYKHPGTLTRA